MNMITWNIRGCNHARKIKTMEKMLKRKKPMIRFLQEIKCKLETMDKVGQRMWKGCKVMALDAIGSVGVISIL